MPDPGRCWFSLVFFFILIQLPAQLTLEVPPNAGSLNLNVVVAPSTCIILMGDVDKVRQVHSLYVGDSSTALSVRPLSGNMFDIKALRPGTYSIESSVWMQVSAADRSSACRPYGSVNESQWTHLCLPFKVSKDYRPLFTGEWTATSPVEFKSMWSPSEVALATEQFMDYVVTKLNNRHILLAGDSTMRELGELLLLMLSGGKWDRSWASYACSTTKKVGDIRAGFGATVRGVRVTFMWTASGSEPCKNNGIGIRGFQRPDDLLYYQNYFAKYGIDTDGNKTDVLLFNSGLHDIRSYVTASELSAKFQASLIEATRFLEPYTTNFVWKSVSPESAKQFSCEASDRASFVNVINKEAEKVMRAFGFPIFDQHALLSGLHAWGVDGHHCTHMHSFADKDLALQYTDITCLESAKRLLFMLADVVGE